MTQNAEGARQFALYLDESGVFLETRPRGANTTDTIVVASQEVGFVAPFRDDIGQVARSIMQEILVANGLPPDEPIHGMELPKGRLNALVGSLIPHLRRHSWQPVRISNREGLHYGTKRDINQTNIIAELVLRLCELTARHPEDEIEMFLKHDRIVIAKPRPGVPPPEILKESVVRPIQEYLSFAAVRRGFGSRKRFWTLNVPGQLFGRAKTDPELQICDLLCSITRNSFKFCYPLLRRDLEEILGDYNLTVGSVDVIQQIDEVITKFGSYGLAIQLAAEHTYVLNEGPGPSALSNRINHVIDELIRLGQRARDSQLATVVIWLEQIIGAQRLAAAGLDITDWIRLVVIPRMRELLAERGDGSAVDWFEYAVCRWQLTAANHLGELSRAQTVVEILRDLQESLAGRVEHLPLLMEGLITQSIHMMDSFDFPGAVANLQNVSDSLKTQSTNISTLLSRPVDATTTYELRARALGALMSALIARGFSDDDEVAYARLVSDEAILEFADADGKARQCQLRSHLEALAGDFHQARRFLLMSLRLDPDSSVASHDSISAALGQIRDSSGFDYRFAIAHWLRIGARAGIVGNKAESSLVYEALTRSSLASDAWVTGKNTEYPAHIIQRYLAALHAANGDAPSALLALERLCEMAQGPRDSLVLRSIAVAGMAEVASILWPSESAEEILGIGTGKLRGLKKMLVVSEADSEMFPLMSQRFEIWTSWLEEFDRDSENISILRRIGDSVTW